MKLEVFERWSFVCVMFPAVEHYLVEWVRTAGRWWDTVALLNLRRNFIAYHVRVRNAAVRDELLDEDTERPGVRLAAELVVECCFRRCPLEGE